MGRRLSFLLQLVLNFFVGVRGSLPNGNGNPRIRLESQDRLSRVGVLAFGVWRIGVLAYWRLAISD